MIIVNSFFLGIYDYNKENSEMQPWQNILVNKSESFYIAFFTVEAAIKIIAMGMIFGEGSYLRDPWNWLDFAVVITSLMSILP